MLIAIDIGNSSINIGFFSGRKVAVRKLDSYPKKSPAEYKAIIEDFMKEKSLEITPEGVIICSVVPGHTWALKKAGLNLRGKEPLIVRPEIIKGLNFDVKNPGEVGSDRLAGAVAASELFGVPVAVVDFGTATTVNFIGSGNTFKGGAIIAGLGMMKEALSKKTAKLPDVRLREPLSPLGKDTEENILSGIIYGTAGAVERIIKDVEELEGQRYKTVITGGYMELMRQKMRRRDFAEPNLTLRGLKIIYERYIG